MRRIFGCFNPRPRVGGDTRNIRAIPTSLCFNPRPRVGGDEVSEAKVLDAKVSIHAPAWGATGGYRGGGGHPICFNPRPRVGGDSRARERAAGRARVSIHAPAWGATLYVASSSWRAVFQSTPPRGGRLASRLSFAMLISFNPRPRVGGDPAGGPGSGRGSVSIHAPAWGATPSSDSTRAEYEFQSTPPRGGRPNTWIKLCSKYSFNPRPRVGGDIGMKSECRMLEVFQSTPPRGGRRLWAKTTRWTVCFNPRPRVGGDCCKLIRCVAIRK